MVDQAIIDTAKRYIRSIPKNMELKKAYLFCSYARGKEHTDSDIHPSRSGQTDGLHNDKARSCRHALFSPKNPLFHHGSQEPAGFVYPFHRMGNAPAVVLIYSGTAL